MGSAALVSREASSLGCITVASSYRYTPEDVRAVRLKGKAAILLPFAKFFRLTKKDLNRPF